MKLGEGFMLVACLIWLSASVGPWKLGVAIVLFAWLLNFAEHYVIAYFVKRRLDTIGKMP